MKYIFLKIKCLNKNWNYQCVTEITNERDIFIFIDNLYNMEGRLLDDYDTVGFFYDFKIPLDGFNTGIMKIDYLNISKEDFLVLKKYL